MTLTVTFTPILLGIAAPVLTLTSGTDNPPVVTRDIPETAGEGDHIQRRIDTADTYDTVDYLTEERILVWDGADYIISDVDTFEASPFTIQDGLDNGTDYYMSERFRRNLGDDDLYSDWSDDVTFNMAAAAVNNDVIVAEGDSITGSFSPSYVDLFDAAYPSYTVHNTAVGGSVIAGGAPSLAARKTTDRAYDAEVISFFIGSNDLSTYPSAAAFYAALVAHVADFRTDGAKVVLCTPPYLAVGGYAAHNLKVDAVSVLMRAGVGTDFDYLADFTASPMGSYTAMSNPTYSSDGQHYTATGHQAVYPNWRGAVLAALGVSHNVEQFFFTDNDTATASAVTTSGSIMVQGLAYGETKAVSVSGGEYRKTPYATGVAGSWGTTAGTVTVGDLIEVRGTASGTPAATVDVVLTIGSVSDTFTITTASGGESASAWATSTGTNKSTWVTVGGSGNKVARGTAGFASVPTSVRNPTERATKRWIEYVVSTRGAYPIYVGLDDGTDYLGDGGTTNYTRPGRDNSTGIDFKTGNSFSTWQICHGGSVVQSGTVSGDPINGSRLGIEYDWDDATNMLLSVKFFTYKSSAWTQIGTTITNVAMTHCYANCGFEDDTTLTGAFAAADQIRTLTSGYVPYDN